MDKLTRKVLAPARVFRSARRRNIAEGRSPYVLFKIQTPSDCTAGARGRSWPLRWQSDCGSQASSTPFPAA